MMPGTLRPAQIEIVGHRLQVGRLGPQSGESMRFDFPRWLPREAFVDELDRLMPAEGRERFYGDLYARLRDR